MRLQLGQWCNGKMCRKRERAELRQPSIGHCHNSVAVQCLSALSGFDCILFAARVFRPGDKKAPESSDLLFVATCTGKQQQESREMASALMMRAAAGATALAAAPAPRVAVPVVPVPRPSRQVAARAAKLEKPNRLWVRDHSCIGQELWHCCLSCAALATHFHISAGAGHRLVPRSRGRATP